MSRIETSCTETSTHDLPTRQLTGIQVPRQSPQPARPASTTVTLLQPPNDVPSGMANNLYSARSTAPRLTTSDGGATTPTSALTSQLIQTDARISQLSQRQPDFQLQIAIAFKTTLDMLFPDVRQPLDPEHIYVTEYVNNTVVLSGDNEIQERRPTSSASLSQVLQNTIQNGFTPDYDIQKTGFFYAAGNAANNPAQVVRGMHTAQHVTLFETALRASVASCTIVYQNAVKNFWDKPDALSTAQLSPKAQLIAAYREQRKAEAILRMNETTLSATGKQLLDQVYADDQGGGSGNKPGVFSLSLQENGVSGQIPFAGAFLVTRSSADRPDTTSGPVLLVMPGQSIMEFTSAQAYRNMLQTWLTHKDQRALLLEHVDNENSARADRIFNQIVPDNAGLTGFFRYDAITAPVLAGCIQARLERQQRDIAFAINTCQNEFRSPETALHDALDLRPVFDVAGIQDAQPQLLAAKFLQNASTDDIREWCAALRQYQIAFKKIQTSGLPLMRQYLDPGFLNTYASARVKEHVRRDLGFDIDPDQVIVTTQNYIEHKPPIPANTIIRKVPFSRTLTALALANASQLGDAGWSEIVVKDTDGYVVPRMTHDYLSRMVRTVDIGRHYRELLQAHLLDSAESKARETQYMQFLAAHLQLDSREAKIIGDISDDGMRLVLDTLKQTSAIRNGQPIQARRLTLRGNSLSTILLFGTQAPVLAGQIRRTSSAGSSVQDAVQSGTGIAKVVLYTPDAPDGKRLREFSSRAEMRRTFIRNPAMRNYLLQHVNLSQQAAVSASLGDDVINDIAIDGNFMQASYRKQARQIIANADARTTSNAEDDAQERWKKINLALDIAGIFLPPKITIPLSLMRAAHTFFSAHEALLRDQKEDALQTFFEGIGLLGSAALDGSGSSFSLHKSSRHVSDTLHGGTTTPLRKTAPMSLRKLAPESATTSSDTPAGMTAIRIDDKTYYYWQSTRNTVNYRDLFEHDTAHPGQLKSAGYGAPDSNNVWKKISLHGGGQGALSKIRGSSRVTPLNKDVEQLILKGPGSDSGTNYFFANITGQNRRLIYNLEDNSFSDPTSVQRHRYFPRYNEMVRLNPQAARTVTDTQREATLRALGITLKLPLALPDNAAANATPIPRLIHSVWVGGEIPAAQREAILASLKNNADMARRGPHPYEMKLYLSNRDPVAYANNLAHLRSGAPDVPVVVLEDTPFYQHFRQSKYFNQYLAAIDGNGGVATNYASAADVLRYRLLQHEGGLYLDCDDTLMAPPGSIEIKTTRNGLALDEPVENSILGMDMQYNTSIFGSQKNNPTLEAISEESYQRFLHTPGLYTEQRPKRFTTAQRLAARPGQITANEQQLHAYMRKISYVTGPSVFNKIIDDRLPDLRQVREAVKLNAHHWNFNLPLRTKITIIALADMSLPLGKINEVGNAHTWEESRR